MRRNYSLYICIICLILLNIFILINSINFSNKQDKYFRLHVVANSNSIDDQITKLHVTKKINNYLSALYQNYDYIDLRNKDSAKSIIENNINNILEVANNELIKQNSNYTCYANIGKISYDEKNSELINMEKGIYDSVQLVLGNGKGENFWSLIFPYSYNPNFNIASNQDDILYKEDIEIKSKFLETVEKVVKTFKS